MAGPVVVCCKYSRQDLKIRVRSGLEDCSEAGLKLESRSRNLEAGNESRTELHRQFSPKTTSDSSNDDAGAKC